MYLWQGERKKARNVESGSLKDEDDMKVIVARGWKWHKEASHELCASCLWPIYQQYGRLGSRGGGGWGFNMMNSNIICSNHNHINNINNDVDNDDKIWVITDLKGIDREDSTALEHV